MKDDIFRKNIGNRIKQLRKEHGLTQQELADKLNLAKSSISSYEGGARMPSYEMLINMSTYFNCSIDFLMGLTSIEKPKEKIELTVDELDEFINIKFKDIKQDILNDIVDGIKKCIKNTER